MRVLTSAGDVLSRSAAPARRRSTFIQAGSTIAFRVADPMLKGSKAPARRASSKMGRCGKPLRRNTSVECRATQGGYSNDISKSEESWRDWRPFSNLVPLAFIGAKPLMGDFCCHSTRSPAG